MMRLLRGILPLLIILLLPGVLAAANRAVPDKAVLDHLQTTAPTGRIVIKFAENADVTVTANGLVSNRSRTAARLSALLAKVAPGAVLERRFTRSAAAIITERRQAEVRSGWILPDLNKYATLRGVAPATDRQELLRVVQDLIADPEVEMAFLEPVPVPAALGFDAFTGAAPAAADPPGAVDVTATPDFSGLQGYLDDTPDGIGAFLVAGNPGADGVSVKVIDVEGAWLWAHEDLPDSFATLGTPVESLSWRNHGTAVLGEIRGHDNGLGVLGIAPACSVGGSSIGDQWTADAINNAAALLAAGDVILIELHAPGPNADGNGQFGYVPMEFWQDNFDAILLATAAGVIVCEAAGNGQQDLDDPVYQGLFDRNVRDSGAIMCGASDGPALWPAWFTNHGTRVDLHGWGNSVVTCAYGTLQGEPTYPEEQWYTDSFNGTSSASPIVVGAVVSLQGMVKSSYGFALDAGLARQILTQSGTPQEGSALIGPRPYLPAAWTLAASGIGEVTGTVTDAGTALPLAAVNVRVDETGGISLTGGDGGYRFPLLVGGYNLTFSSFFYQTTTLPATISNGGTTVLDVALAAKPTVDIAGRVYDFSGSPLANVHVTPLDVPLAGDITTGGGDYLISGAPIDTTYLLLYDGLPGYGAEVHLVNSSVPPGSTIPVFKALPAVWQDFESDSGGFTADSTWTYGTPQAGGPAPNAFSGSKCWGVGMTGDYEDDESGILTSPVYDFSQPGVAVLYLSFHYWSETEAGFDGVQVQVFDGINFTTREPLPGYSDLSLGGLDYGPGWSGSIGSWRGTVFDLSDQIGPTVLFRLVFGSDGGVNGPGFWVDEIAFDTGDPVGVGDDPVTPSALGPALAVFPNPFNPSATIAWRVTRPGRLRIDVHDLRGRLVRRLLDGSVSELAGTVRWDGRDTEGRPAASGVYLVRLQESDDRAVTRRVLLAK